MPRPESAALPITYVVLRILIILNWLMFAVTLFLLVAPFAREWMMSSLDLAPSVEADRVVFGLRAIAVVGLILVPIYHFILTRLVAIVETARDGDPFVTANAARLRQIGWAGIGLQCCGLAIALIVDIISSKAHPIKIDTGPSVAGWLAILLAFVLAWVFDEGARMRDDLAGTV